MSQAVAKTLPEALKKSRVLMWFAAGVEVLQVFFRHLTDDVVHQSGRCIHLFGDSSSDLCLCQPPPLLALQAVALLSHRRSDQCQVVRCRFRSITQLVAVEEVLE